MKKSIYLCLIILIFIISFSVFAETDKSVLSLNYKNNLLSAELQSATIKDIFEELKKQAGINYEIEKEIQEQKVTISFKDKELVKGIEDILNTIGNPSYMINYKKDKDGKDEIAGINITKRGKTDLDSTKTVGDEKIKEMIDFAKDKSKAKFERINAIGRLGKMKVKESRTDLEEMLKKDEDGDIRMASAIGLGLIGEKESIPVLKEALKDKEIKVSLRAAYMLGKMGDDSGFNLARGNIEDSEAVNREYAVEALGIIGKDEAKPLIEEAKKDKNVWVRIKSKIAEKELGLKQSKDRIKYLKDTIEKDEQYEVQIWAGEKLIDEGEKGAKSLEEISKDKNNQGSSAANKVIIRMGIK